MRSTRRFRPSGGKRKAPGRNGICHPVKPATSSKTATKTLHSAADKTEMKRKTLSYWVNVYIKAWAIEAPLPYACSSSFQWNGLLKEKEVGEDFDGWPQAWSGGISLFTKKQRHYSETGGGKEEKKIKPLGMNGAPS